MIHQGGDSLSLFCSITGAIVVGTHGIPVILDVEVYITERTAAGRRPVVIFHDRGHGCSDATYQRLAGNKRVEGGFLAPVGSGEKFLGRRGAGSGATGLTGEFCLAVGALQGRSGFELLLDSRHHPFHGFGKLIDGIAAVERISKHGSCACLCRNHHESGVIVNVKNIIEGLPGGYCGENRLKGMPILFSITGTYELCCDGLGLIEAHCCSVIAEYRTQCKGGEGHQSCVLSHSVERV